MRFRRVRSGRTQHPASTASTSFWSGRAPARPSTGIEDVGNLAAFLVGDGAAALTGNVEYIDASYHIVG